MKATAADAEQHAAVGAEWRSANPPTENQVLMALERQRKPAE